MGFLPEDENQNSPQLVKLGNKSPFKCAHVVAGHRHSAAITQSGELYVWGHKNNGLLGLGDSDSSSNDFVPLPVFHPFFKGVRILQVSCSDAHTAIITENNELFVWGARVGESPPTFSNKPEQVDINEKVR